MSGTPFIVRMGPVVVGLTALVVGLLGILAGEHLSVYLYIFVLGGYMLLLEALK